MHDSLKRTSYSLCVIVKISGTQSTAPRLLAISPYHSFEDFWISPAISRSLSLLEGRSYSFQNEKSFFFLFLLFFLTLSCSTEVEPQLSVESVIDNAPTSTLQASASRRGCFWNDRRPRSSNFHYKVPFCMMISFMILKLNRTGFVFASQTSMSRSDAL